MNKVSVMRLLLLNSGIYKPERLTILQASRHVKKGKEKLYSYNYNIGL